MKHAYIFVCIGLTARMKYMFWKLAYYMQ